MGRLERKILKRKIEKEGWMKAGYAIFFVCYQCAGVERVSMYTVRMNHLHKDKRGYSMFYNLVAFKSEKEAEGFAKNLCKNIKP